MLSYEEIEYVCEIFVALGIEKIPFDGWRAMMRRDIETIIRKLAKLKVPAMSDKLRFVDDAREKPPSSENDKLKLSDTQHSSISPSRPTAISCPSVHKA